MRSSVKMFLLLCVSVLLVISFTGVVFAEKNNFDYVIFVKRVSEGHSALGKLFWSDNLKNNNVNHVKWVLASAECIPVSKAIVSVTVVKDNKTIHLPIKYTDKDGLLILSIDTYYYYISPDKFPHVNISKAGYESCDFVLTYPPGLQDMLGSAIMGYPVELYMPMRSISPSKIKK